MFYTTRYTTILIVLIILSVSVSTISLSPPGYASGDPYDSGYDHGCDDAKISEADDRYINEPGKGPEFHTDAFMRGYNDGFDKCSYDDRDDSGPDDGTQLPLCDGSYQDCITEEGFFCKAGSTEHECECEEDMSNCPNHPSLNENVEGPDEDCLFDPDLAKCTPGLEGCPEGFGQNVDGQCIPHGGCPEGYHRVEDDETGTCYSDELPCPKGYVMHRYADSTSCIDEDL